MVSPQTAREMILPDILTEMAAMERTIFHLDGPQALGHLDALLATPQLSALQWVYGAGHGPAAKWIEVYQRAQAAGKAVQVLAETPQDALAVLGQLRPEGVWLCVDQGFADAAEADAFLREVERTALGRR
jgi:hypothetical protein